MEVNQHCLNPFKEGRTAASPHLDIFQGVRAGIIHPHGTGEGVAATHYYGKICSCSVCSRTDVGLGAVLVILLEKKQMQQMLSKACSYPLGTCLEHPSASISPRGPSLGQPEPEVPGDSCPWEQFSVLVGGRWRINMSAQLTNFVISLFKICALAVLFIPQVAFLMTVFC